jgi:hypothetical protein
VSYRAEWIARQPKYTSQEVGDLGLAWDKDVCGLDDQFSICDKEGFFFYSATRSILGTT